MTMPVIDMVKLHTSLKLLQRDAMRRGQLKIVMMYAYSLARIEEDIKDNAKTPD